MNRRSFHRVQAGAAALGHTAICRVELRTPFLRSSHKLASTALSSFAHKAQCLFNVRVIRFDFVGFLQLRGPIFQVA